MKTHRHQKPEAGSKQRQRRPIQLTDLLTHAVKTLIGALIAILLTSLLSLVIFAFIIKAFTMSDETSFQLLNNAITVLGPALGAVVGYFLGRKPM